MARNRLPSDRNSVEPTIDEVFEALEEALELIPSRTETEWLSTPAPHSEAELDELRDELRATVERLEFEAARVRWQLEMLDTSTRPAWYH